jgi:polysaccharide export outer membrane protein
MAPRLSLHLFLVFMLTFASLSEAAPFRLDSGDILEISVFRRDDLNRRMTVDADGNIWVPLVGEVRASGLTLPELRSKVRDLLAGSDSVRGADVMVDLVEHRPFFIHGSVLKAGAFPYRPGMTIRHALALAGGLSLSGASGSFAIAPVAGAELRGKFEELKGQIAAQQIRVAGLRAEAETKTEINTTALARAIASRPEIARLIQLETDRIMARQAEREKEQQYLRNSIKLSDTQVSTLEEGQKADEEATRLQYEEYERVAELSRKGLAPTSRVSDQQQAAVLFKIRERDTAGRLAFARLAREELVRKLEKVDDRPVRIPLELQEAMKTLEQMKTQLASLGQQITLSGATNSMLGNPENVSVDITIFRKDRTGAQVRIAANEDSDVEASDVVEVKLKLDWLSSTPAN